MQDEKSQLVSPPAPEKWGRPQSWGAHLGFSITFTDEQLEMIAKHRPV